MTSMPDHLRITTPDDWHLHLRSGAMLRLVLPDSCRWCDRAIIMPNLKAPITSRQSVLRYKAAILKARPAQATFSPLMTLYLTDTTDPDTLEELYAQGLVFAAKLYPAGATTNAESGVTDIRNIDQMLQRMAEIGMPLLIHGEVVDPDVDIFDREAVFIERILKPLRERQPDLRITLEHITTCEAVRFVTAAGERTGATITAHHLHINRNHLFEGGVRPHHYCLPIAKREHHRQALIEIATSGHPRFFAGTDSAPHTPAHKQSACGCAGIYTAHAALEFYAEVFEAAGALETLETFVSLNGARFYGLPPNRSTLTLRKRERRLPSILGAGRTSVVPFRGGTPIHWDIAS